MNKKIFIFLFITIMSFGIFVPKSNADMGPKPTALIEVIGVEQPYYFEVFTFSNKEIEVLAGENLNVVIDKLKYSYYQEYYPLDILNGYQDNDGYVARSIYDLRPTNITVDKNNKNLYELGYFSAPAKFKIAIILNDGTIINSNIINRRLFNSNMTFDLTSVDLTYSQDGVGIVKEVFPISKMTTSFIARVFLTIAIELFILFVFMYKNKFSFILVGFTNLITQTILTLFTLFAMYFWSPLFGVILIFILGEIIVFTIEPIVYSRFLKEHSKNRAVVYALIANLASLIISLIAMMVIGI